MVILFAVLTCVITDREQDSLMKEVLRVLKPGGFVYINDFLVNDDDRNKNRYQAFKEKYNTYGVFELPEGALLRHHTETRVMQLTHDFHEVAFNRTTFKTMNGNLSNGFVFMGRKS
jgi:ubiquinone/menaquinone biosynthesis C-methylase UbiE